MSEPKADAVAAEETDADALEALEARGDVDALLEAAREARTAKDMMRCLACYEAAARLGSGDAHFAAALFHLGGQIVAQDFKKGTTHLRAAAEAGVLNAKVYVANLYELGIHYAPDVEKADVWYRSAARTAGIEEGSDDYAQRMADLGCARHYLELAADEKTTDAQRETWARKARTLGYQLKTRSGADIAPASRSSPEAAPVVEPAKAEPAPEPKAPEPKKPEPKKKEEAKKKPERTWLTPGLGLRAFGVVLLFMGAALATGFLGAEGARIVIADRGPLPVLGDHPERAYGIAIALIGVLPALLVYRARTVAAAIGAAALTAAIGFWLHGSPSGTWLHPRALQVLAFALAGFLGAAATLGIFGGAKPSKKGLA